MTRFSAGLLTGIIGAALLVVVDLVSIRGLPLLIPIVTGVIAGMLVARNPTFAGKTGGAGALAGLIAGAVFFIASIVVGIVSLNSGTTQHVISVVEATATARAGSGTTRATNVPIATIVDVGLVVGSCIAGLFYLGFSTAAGAIAGAISGRNTVPPMQVPSQAGFYVPPTAPPYSPPPGYPPPPPPPGYGA